MTSNTDLSRRRMLRLFGATPMLPLGAGGVAALLAGCGGGDDEVAPPVNTTPPTYASVVFTGMNAPSLTDAAAMAKTYVASSMTVNFSDTSKIDIKLAYQPFFVTGDMVPDGKGGTILAGGYYDINNKAIIDTTVPGKERQFFSDSPDGTSLLTVANASVAGVKGNTVFAVVQFEYTSLAQDEKTSMYGMLPSPIAVLTLDQDKATGKLSLVKYHNVDTSSVNGLWITCSARISLPYCC